MRVGRVEVAIEMLLELAHVVEVGGVRRSERVALEVELSEEVKGAIALGLGEEEGMRVGVRVRVKRKDVEVKGVETRVEDSRTIDTM